MIFPSIYILAVYGRSLAKWRRTRTHACAMCCGATTCRSKIPEGATIHAAGLTKRRYKSSLSHPLDSRTRPTERNSCATDSAIHSGAPAFIVTLPGLPSWKAVPERKFSRLVCTQIVVSSVYYAITVTICVRCGASCTSVHVLYIP